MSWLSDTFFGDQAGGTKQAGNVGLLPDGSRAGVACATPEESIKEGNVLGA